MPLVPEPEPSVQPDKLPSPLMEQVVTPPVGSAFVAYRVVPLMANCHGDENWLPVLLQPDKLPSSPTLQRYTAWLFQSATYAKLLPLNTMPVGAPKPLPPVAVQLAKVPSTCSTQ